MLWTLRGYVCLCIGLLVVRGRAQATEYFDEELTLRPLRDGKVASRFSFVTLLEGVRPRDPRSLGSEDRPQHYTVFPLALGQILREYAVTELHLSLNTGNWNYGRWGYPAEPGVGSGAELWAWMGDGAPSSVDERWQGLRNALAGLFCASLGNLDEQRTTSPMLAFQPEGSLPRRVLPHQLRHASLPAEGVCTENLTPFLKLLPCKSLSGIASLLNPHRVFDADWHGMGIHVLWHPDRGVELRLTFQAVMDPVRGSVGNKRDWSLNSLYDREVSRLCPVANSSRVIVGLPQSEAYVIEPEPSIIEGNNAIYDVAGADTPLDIELKWPLEIKFEYPLSRTDVHSTRFSVQRTLKGSTQARGTLSVLITNFGSSPMEVIYVETMPWLVQFYLHTMRIRANGVVRVDLVSNVSYVPPIPHERPTTFQSVLSLPANGTLHLTMDVSKAFLRYTEHPPDAQRGWDLPPAVFVPLAENGTRLQQVYTPTILVDLATPDFSMPYNVIIMSCSLIAMIFGSVFNLLTRRFVVVRIGPRLEK